MTTYANTVEIPSVSPTGTGGAMIIDNFKTLADITCKTGTGTIDGVTIGKDCATNSVTGSGSVIVGGYNCKASIQNAVVTNMDRSDLNVGGYTFLKGITLYGSSSFHDETTCVADIPAGGYAYLRFQLINPGMGYVGESSLEVLPTSSGSITPAEYDSSYINVRFYLNGGKLYIENEGWEVQQVSIWGTILGEVTSGGTGSDDSSTSW